MQKSELEIIYEYTRQRMINIFHRSLLPFQLSNEESKQ